MVGPRVQMKMILVRMVVGAVDQIHELGLRLAGLLVGRLRASVTAVSQARAAVTPLDDFHPLLERVFLVLAGFAF